MRGILIKILQIIIVLIGIAVLFFMIRFPLTEGRAQNLDLISIYADPLILYTYLASIAFLVALYKSFKLLGYMGPYRLVAPKAIQALRVIKLCSIIQSSAIVMAGVYIKLSHHEDDDPAGILALSILATVIFSSAAIAAARFQKKLRRRLDAESM